MTDQKIIASHLNIAAERYAVIDDNPATHRQVSYLASLIAQDNGSADDVECSITNTQALLSKRAASSYIDHYLNSRRPAAAPTISEYLDNEDY